ncbi:hypothetical protein GH146_04880 [archaeon]|nr:hypothetical protein [archaeon]
MCLLYEEYSFSPARVKDSETTLIIGLTTEVVEYICPVCEEPLPDEAALQEHIKSEHPWHWNFWYAPHGKPLLAVASVGTILAIAFAFAPKEPRIIVVGGGK